MFEMRLKRCTYLDARHIHEHPKTGQVITLARHIAFALLVHYVIQSVASVG